MIGVEGRLLNLRRRRARRTLSQGLQGPQAFPVVDELDLGVDEVVRSSAATLGSMVFIFGGRVRGATLTAFIPTRPGASQSELLVSPKSA